MTDQEKSSVGEPPPQYMIFLLVFFFFLTGLLGFLICHMLKKKGYRCRTGELEDEEEGESKNAADSNADGSEENQDTVEQILKCIIENEANMEAFNEMLGTQNTCEHLDPRLLRKDSIGGVPPHHHTVHSGADRNSCHLCVQSRTKKARRRSRVARFKARPGEQTVFSVGRFRVTHIEKKNSIQESSNLHIAEPCDHIEHHDGSGKAPEAYNLRNMFKDINMEATNGVVPLKSILNSPKRRSSDPAAINVNQERPEQIPVHPANPQQAGNAGDPEDDTDVPTDPEMTSDKGSPGAGDPDSSHGTKGYTGVTRVTPGEAHKFCVTLQEASQVEDGRDDMVEMEDIKDCRVSQSEDSGDPPHDQKRRSVHTQLKW